MRPDNNFRAFLARAHNDLALPGEPDGMGCLHALCGWVRSARWRGVVRWPVVGLVGALALGGCGEGVSPKQSTPEETMATARAFLTADEGERLHELVYATSPDMRQFLSRSGRMLGNLEKLSDVIQQKWPEDVARLQQRAEEAAKAGKPTGLLGQVVGQATRRQGNRQAGRPGSRRGGPPAAEQRKGFDDGITRLFADPYAFVRESEGKLAAVYMTEDQRALTWDGKPVLAPLGMTMRLGEDGKWYFELPLNIPGVSGFVPKTKEQWELFGGVITVLDRVIVDLTKEIETGQLQTLEAVSRRAGEMTFVPAAMVLYAYTKLREEQGGK